jgi:hypothetical protein
MGFLAKEPKLGSEWRICQRASDMYIVGQIDDETK